MVFEFSETTHKWCPQCAGNIRKTAEWCRFCLRNVSSKFRSSELFPPLHLVASVMPWLLGHDELTMNVSTGFRERFQRMHDETVEQFRETAPNYDEIRRQKRIDYPCPDEPPEAEAFGLLQDILLSMHDCGEDMQKVCSKPRLMLLDITPQLIADEALLRRQEEGNGNVCKFCQEFVFPEDVCRFCKSNGVEPTVSPPLMVGFVKPPDLGFLSAIILWEAAKRQRQSISRIDDALLDRYCINPEDIEAEVRRQIENPDAVPMSRWRGRVRDLNITTMRSFGDSHIEDILKLASSCDWAQKYDETVIVYHHGLSLVGDDPSMRLCKQRLLEGLGNHYLLVNDNENHLKYSGMASALMSSMLTGKSKERYEESREQTQMVLGSFAKRMKMSPEERLKEVEQQIQKLEEEHSHQQGQPEDEEFSASSVLRKIASASQCFVLEKLKEAAQSLRRQIEIDSAMNAGDHDRAAQLYQQEISSCGSGVNDLDVRSSLYCSLAEVQRLSGKFEEADESHRKAISVAEELIELREGREYSPISRASHSYAKFLIEMKRFDESHFYLTRALEMEEQSVRRSDIEFGKANPSVSQHEAAIRETFAVLMSQTGRQAEADRLLAEAAEIRVKYREQEGI